MELKLVKKYILRPLYARSRPIGTSVKAPVGGVVTLAPPDMFLSGGTLIVDHGHGLSSTFIISSAPLNTYANKRYWVFG